MVFIYITSTRSRLKFPLLKFGASFILESGRPRTVERRCRASRPLSLSVCFLWSALSGVCTFSTIIYLSRCTSHQLHTDSCITFLHSNGRVNSTVNYAALTALPSLGLGSFYTSDPASAPSLWLIYVMWTQVREWRIVHKIAYLPKKKLKTKLHFVWATAWEIEPRGQSQIRHLIDHQVDEVFINIIN